MLFFPFLLKSFIFSIAGVYVLVKDDIKYEWIYHATKIQYIKIKLISVL